MFKRQQNMKSLLTLITLILGVASYGQVDYDKRLLAKYSEEKIKELIVKQPSLVDYWTYYLDNSYTIIDGEVSGKFLMTDQEVKIKKMDQFNIFELGIYMDGYATKYFRIAGTDKFLALKSTQQFVKEYASNRKANN